MQILMLSGLLLGLAVFALRRARMSRCEKLIRRRREIGLVPNRLLTRHPIVLLGPRPTLWRTAPIWGAIPHDLTEHGYTVLEIEATDGPSAERAALKLPFAHHLVVHPRLARDLRTDRLRLMGKLSQTVTVFPTSPIAGSEILTGLRLVENSLGLTAADLNSALALTNDLAESDFLRGRDSNEARLV
jgi:hypothetical protein